MPVSPPPAGKLGTLSLLSIGIGGMVGGGIFAVTGLAVQVARGGAPVAFLIAGVVAILTSYSYLKLSLRFPGPGGTVDFLNRGFGTGVLTGAANVLLLLSYVILVSIYAYAFGTYGSTLLPPEGRELGARLLSSGAIVGLLLVNLFGSALVVRSENVFNVVKLLLLGGFVVAGFLTPMDWSRLEWAQYAAPTSLVAGAMLIFLNYEGFELIANASGEAATPRRSLPVAYLGGVAFVIVLYVLITTVVLGHLSFGAIAAGRDRVLAEAAGQILGRVGLVAMTVAALLATTSAINATFYSSGRLAWMIAKSGELPTVLERSYRGQHTAGSLGMAALALLAVNLVPLEAIAAMGSAGFLLIFMAVNAANVRLAHETGSRAWLSLVAATSAGLALVILCVKVEENPASRNHLWILAGMVAASFLIESGYRRMRRQTDTERKAAP